LPARKPRNSPYESRQRACFSCHFGPGPRM
jgi:hypothetical protein